VGPNNDFDGALPAMKVVRVILYVLGGLFLVLIGLIAYVAIFVPDPGPSGIGVAQSVTVGGKTVHVVTNGAVTYNSTIEDGQIVVNDKKFELSDGDEFTLTINADGTSTVRPGKP
jgi:hypothetical protein